MWHNIQYTTYNVPYIKYYIEGTHAIYYIVSTIISFIRAGRLAFFPTHLYPFIKPFSKGFNQFCVLFIYPVVFSSSLFINHKIKCFDFQTT